MSPTASEHNSFTSGSAGHRDKPTNVFVLPALDLTDPRAVAGIELALDGVADPAGMRCTFQEWLQEACRETIGSFDGSPLIVRVGISVEGYCPFEHWRAVRVAVSEMAANAVEHGFRQRVLGRIDVKVSNTGSAFTQIDVTDDGWGFDVSKIREGGGFRRLRMLGDVCLSNRSSPTAVRTTTASLRIKPYRSTRWTPRIANVAG